jgi:hypothetical protein
LAVDSLLNNYRVNIPDSTANVKSFMKKNPAVAGSLTLQLRCGDLTIVSHSLPTSAVTLRGQERGNPELRFLFLTVNFLYNGFLS